MSPPETRRAFLVSSTAVGTGLLLGCRRDEDAPRDPGKTSASAAELGRTKEGSTSEEAEVTAVEDLMREHGVIRRSLVVYRETAMRLRTKPADVPSDALRKTAKLLRSFAEDYHERQLEETHIFPALRRAGGAAAGYVDVLVTQHNRGREINDYVMTAAGATIGPVNVEPVARVLEAFARMYEEHAAVEDTIIFPAWKKTMSEKQLDEMGELFEDIEHKTFGKDGFDDAVQQITVIERAFGFELAQFTPVAPSKP